MTAIDLNSGYYDSDHNIERLITLSDDPKYASLAVESKQAYAENTPYPHIVFDDFLPNDIAMRLSQHYPDPRYINEDWKFHHHDQVQRYFLDDATKFALPLRLFSTAISSSPFIIFLETLTGIKSLQADPFFKGSGAMTKEAGGCLNVHVDYNWQQKNQAWHRINALFYLTPDWREEWEGNLELWTKDGQSTVKEVTPPFNRAVIFDTTKDSYHGHPVPLKTPSDKFRNVFSAFFYSNQKSDAIDDSPHFTKYLSDTRHQVAQFETSPFAEKITNDYIKSAEQ